MIFFHFSICSLQTISILPSLLFFNSITVFSSCKNLNSKLENKQYKSILFIFILPLLNPVLLYHLCKLHSFHRLHICIYLFLTFYPVELTYQDLQT